HWLFLLHPGREKGTHRRSLCAVAGTHGGTRKRANGGDGGSAVALARSAPGGGAVADAGLAARAQGAVRFLVPFLSAPVPGGPRGPGVRTPGTRTGRDLHRALDRNQAGRFSAVSGGRLSRACR